MVDADSGYTSEEDSPEMKTLKKEHLHPSNVSGFDPSKLTPSSQSSKITESILQQGYTVLDPQIRS
jgi:hypothetical protein